MSEGSTIQYGKPGAAVASFQIAKISAMPFTEVIDGLHREIEAAGLWVLGEIDPQKVAQRAKYAIGGARQILFFHPDLLLRLLQADQSAILEAPLKIAAMEMMDGNVAVRWMDPAASLARYANPALAALGQELAVVCETIVAASLRQ